MGPTKQRKEIGIPKGYIGINELCEILGRSRATINRWIAEDALPKSFRFGGRQRVWDRKEILRWLEFAKFAK